MKLRLKLQTDYTEFLQKHLIEEFSNLGVAKVEIDFGQETDLSYICVERWEQQYPDLKDAVITYERKRYDWSKPGFPVPVFEEVTQSIWQVCEDFAYEVLTQKYPAWESAEEDAKPLKVSGKVIFDVGAGLIRVEEVN